MGVGGGGGHRVGVAVGYTTPASNHRTPVKRPTECQQVVLKFCDKSMKKPLSNFDSKHLDLYYENVHLSITVQLFLQEELWLDESCMYFLMLKYGSDLAIS